MLTHIACIFPGVLYFRRIQIIRNDPKVTQVTIKCSPKLQLLQGAANFGLNLLPKETAVKKVTELVTADK